MKQCSADLKAQMERLEAQPAPPARDANRPFGRPELRILA
jgi:hypothetical protein